MMSNGFRVVLKSIRFELFLNNIQWLGLCIAIQISILSPHTHAQNSNVEYNW